MKIFRLSAQNIRIGNVGSFDSDNDRNRLYMVSDWLGLNDPEYAEGATFSNDNIDLNRGRDFLKENNTYDIVVLHDIFNPIDYGDRNKQGIFSTSDLHSQSEWSRRLVSTHADYLFVFGSWGEIGGWWLGDIPGYTTYHGRSEYQTVYRNQNMPPITVEDPNKRLIDWENADISWLKEPTD